MSITIGKTRKKGNKQPISSISILNLQDLYTFAVRMISHQAEAERLVLKTLEEATKITYVHSDISDLKATLFKILYQTYLDQDRRNKSNYKEKKINLTIEFSLYNSFEEHYIFDLNEKLEMIKDIPENEFKDMIEKLPGDLKAVFLLNIIFGFNGSYISYILKIPVKLVKERLKCANSILKLEIWKEINKSYKN